MNWLARSFLTAGIIFGLQVNGQTPDPGVPPGLPATLPMFANTNDMISWIVTNHPVYCGIAIYYIQANGAIGSVGNTATPTVFSSYGAYQNFVATNTVRLVSEAQANANSPIGAGMNIGVDDATVSQPYTPMVVHVTNSSLSGITASWVSNNLTPLYMNICVPVAELQQFTIQVYGLYTNTWNGAQMPTIPPYPPERTLNDWLVLNPWYCIATNEARFTVTANGETQVYTQVGAPLLPSVLLMLDSTHVQIAMTPGSDTTVLYTDDLASGWQTLAVTAWSNNTGAAVFPLNPAASTRKFFRASSK